MAHINKEEQNVICKKMGGTGDPYAKQTQAVSEN